MTSPAEVLEAEVFAAQIRAHVNGRPNGAAPKSEPVPAVAASPWQSLISPCEPAWFTEQPPARTWLLRDSRTALGSGVLPLGKVGLLIGEGGVSKTMTLIAFLIAVATGTPWLGTFTVATKGRVLALLGEEDTEEIRRRCYHVAQATGGRIPDPGSIVTLPLAGVPCAMIETDERGNATDTAFLTWVRTYVREHGPFVAVVWDPLSRFAGADAESDNAAATRFVQAAESIAAEGPTVIVAHHTNKLARVSGAAVTGASARGSSAFYDGVRWAATLTAEKVDVADGMFSDLGELVTLTIVKSNYSKKADPLVLRRDEEHGGALIPLDNAELQIVASARRAADPSARRASERERRAEERQDREDAAVTEIVAAEPGIVSRQLRAAVAAKIHIRAGAASEAVDRAVASGRVRRVQDGQSFRHYPGGGT